MGECSFSLIQPLCGLLFTHTHTPTPRSCRDRKEKMFAKATTNLLSEIDPDGSLVAVRRLNDSDKITPLALIIKRNRFWFWQKPKYIPAGFTLNDLLLSGNQPIQPVVKETDFLKYSGVFSKEMSGTVDAGVDAGVGGVNMGVEGKGATKLQSSFGSLRKEELDVHKLLQDSKDKQLDVKHDLMEQVRERRWRVFGLVRERVFTTQECTVLEEQGETGSCSALTKVLTPVKIKVSVEKKGNLEADSNVSLTIPANTTLAYSIIELEVKANGQYELCLLDDLEGGFESDSVDTAQKKCRETVSMPTNLHSTSLLTALKEARKQLDPLASVPVGTRTTLLQQLSEVMKRQEGLDSLELALEQLCGGVTPDLRLLEKDPPLKAQVTSVLQALRPTDSPQPPTALLSAAHLLVSALDELSDEGLSSLSSCCSPPVLQALQQLVQSLASEEACLPLEPALAQEEVFQHVQCLLAASGVNLHREAGTLKVSAGRCPLALDIAVTGLATLGEDKGGKREG